MSSSPSKIRAYSAKVLLAHRRFSQVKSTTRATASAPQKASSRSSDAMRSTDVLLCRCLKCYVPRTTFSALMGAQRVLGLQLCLMVTSYFQRHTPTSQSKTANTIVLDSIVFGSQIRWSRGEKINIGFEIIVFGQILPHKIGVSDLRSPYSQIQFRYTPNTMPIKDGLTYDLSKFFFFLQATFCDPNIPRDNVYE